MRSFRFYSAVVFLLLLSSAAFGATVDRVDISGNRKVPDDRIRPYLIKAGEEFDPAVINNSIKKLQETGLFLEVSVDAEVVNNQFVVTYIIQEVPLIAGITVNGNKKISDSKITEAIATKVGDKVNFTRIGTSVKAIQDMYEKERYFDVKVTHSIVYRNQSTVNIVYDIEEGERSRVYNIWFYGNETFTADELKAAIRTKEKDFWSKLNSSGVLMRDMLEYDRELVRQFYLSKGFLRVEVGEAEVEIQEKHPDRMNYLLRVVEGPRYKIGTVEFVDPNARYTSDELRERTKLEQEEYFNIVQMRNDITKLTAAYREKGFAMANVEPDMKFNEDDKTVSLVYTVEEGNIYTVKRINISGGEKTKDNVVRRQFDLHEGDIYNGKLIDEAEYNLFSSGFYEDVKIRERSTGSDTMELDVDVKEAKSGSLNFILAYTTNESVMTKIEVAQENFMGTGDRVSFMTEFSSERQDYQISYTNPWVYDNPYSFGVDLYSREKEYKYYTRDAIGGVIRVGHQPIKRRLYASYAFAHEQVDIYDIENDASYYIKQQEGKISVNSITPSLTYSHLNNNLDPTDGIKASISAKYAGTFLGGDADFVKGLINISYYKPLGGSFIGVVHAEAGQIWKTSDSDIPIDERFWLGGMYSIRGFKYRDISPRDNDGNEYGGNKFYQLNLEIWRPLLDANLSIRGVVFFDAGQVLDHGQTFLDEDPRFSAGAGIRVFTPVGLLRLEWGYKLNKKDGESASELEFSIGSAF